MTSDGLREPWTSLAAQRESAMLGMWLFLATELLFFGGLFGAYAVYRTLFASQFVEGARQTNIVYGSINTFVLLTSSFALAAGVRSARAGAAAFARACFLITIGLGAAFLVLKGFEYRQDISKHLIPGPDFPIALRGAAIFWSLYWIMTLVHAAHLAIGLGAVLRLYFAGRCDPFWLQRSPAVEVTALYWHFVDIVWVFLFPLLYLAGRA